MSSRSLIGGLVTLWLLFGCRIGMAVAPASVTTPAAPASPTPAPSAPAAAPAPPTIYLAPANPAMSSQNDSPMPAAVALPADTSTSGGAGTVRKFYVLTASLREIYDTNVNTSNNGSASSLETELSPSVLVDFPGENGNGGFTGRYTLGLTYYSTAPGGGGNGSSGNNDGVGNRNSLQVKHELSVAYNHTFSERYSLSAADDFRYDTEPGILQSTGTNYEDGAYYANTLNGSFSAQMTPLFSSSFTYANTIVRYENARVALSQDSLENTGSATLSYAFLPKITLSVGAIGDDITYQSTARGYTTYTLFAGASWQALPSLSFSGRGGGSYIEPGQAPNQPAFPGQPQSTTSSQASVAPYAALTVNWKLGARSALDFSYAHEVTPSDQSESNGQLSDRFNATFSYVITPRLSCHLDGVFTESSYAGGLAGNDQSNYKEGSYQVDAGFSYAYNSNFSFDSDLNYSGVSSNLDNNNYARAEVSLGIRGTY